MKKLIINLAFTEKERQIHGIAFSELISFMEKTVVSSTDVILVFKLSDLVKIYYDNLKDLGHTLETRIHST